MLPAKQKIDADLEDVLGFLDVDWKPEGVSEAGYWSADEIIRIGAEVVIVVLDETGDPVAEGVFNADAYSAAAASIAYGSERTGGEEEGDIISLPRNAALNVAKETVPGITDAAGHRSNRLDSKAIGKVGEKDAVSQVGIGPIIVTLDANYPPPSELIIAAALQTPGHAAGIRAEGPAEKLVRNQNGEILLDPNTADVSAHVAAGPAKKINGHQRRPVCWHAEIGCDCWSGRQSSERNCCEQNLLHNDAPYVVNDTFPLAQIAF